MNFQPENSNLQYGQAWTFDGVGYYNGQQYYNFIEFKEEGLLELPCGKNYIVREKGPTTEPNPYLVAAFLEDYYVLTPIHTHVELLQARTKYYK